MLLYIALPDHAVNMSILSVLKHKISPSYRRPPPIPQASNYVLLILDSCRYDSFVQANPKIMQKLGTLERRWSYASWTAPAHYNILLGLLPHTNPRNVVASTVYKKELLSFSYRLNIPELRFEDMLPRMWLPHYFRSLGYHTQALMSMPVLNPSTPLAVDFDEYVLLHQHNDLEKASSLLNFSSERPTFCLINTGETHYPYAPPQEPESQWPRIQGLHGVFRKLQQGELLETPMFNLERLAQLHKRQVRVLDTVDRAVEKLFDLLPPNTFVTITADHGELFGEGGFFGHGPIQHEKVWEVPFIEGKLR